MYSDSLWTRLTPLFAVITLPLGILAAIFFGTMAAVVVFVVGWFLLTPATAVLFGPPTPGSPWVDEDVQSLVQGRTNEEIQGRSEEGSSEDPVEKLRERYARGDIDEAELERRLDALLETEDVDPDDEESVERAIDNLDTGNPEGDSTSAHDTGAADTSEVTEMERERE